MFSFFKTKEEKELDAMISKIESNMANNYKDAAQDALKKFEERLQNIDMSDAKKASYTSMLENYKTRLKEFTHKDQKPYWT